MASSSISFTLNKAQLKSLEKKLQSSELLEPAIGRFLGRIALHGERAAKEKAPVDRGSLRRRIVAESQGITATVSVVNAQVYDLTMDEGRRKGAPMPPSGPTSQLAAWVRRKGIDTTPFVIARSIARRGIKGRFFMRAGKRAMKDSVPRESVRFFHDVEKRWARK